MNATFNMQVVVRLQFQGVHRWPDADNYLKHPHRHVFFVTAYKDVTHPDRQVEFIELKSEILKTLHDTFESDGGVLQLGRLSCEDLAIMLITKHFLTACEVSEDGENGALVKIGD